jgi:hypothetical protein
VFNHHLCDGIVAKIVEVSCGSSVDFPVKCCRAYSVIIQARLADTVLGWKEMKNLHWLK